MALTVDIQFHDTKWKKILPQKAIREACAAAYKGKNLLTVVLANDAFVRKLNRDFRGKDKPTNVLSFPNDGYLGDIVLARQTIVHEAKEQGKKPRDHAIHLIVHGVLHLQGYDHESKKDAENMEAIEIKILKKLGISNPYL